MKSSDTDSAKFSKTALKRLMAMNKTQLVNMVIQLSNYAEAQKASNIILSNAINEVRNKKAAEMEAGNGETNG